MIQKNTRGFTMLELLITIAILGILCTLAYASYNHYITKVRRTDAQVAIIDLSNRLEQYYITNNHTYAGATLANLNMPNNTVNGFYTLSISNTSATTYLLTATPIGIQAKQDKECGSLSRDQLGQVSISGVGKVGDCWK